MPTVATTSAASLSVLLAGLVSLLATGRARAQHQVEVATADLAATAADLRGARDDLVAQKDYLTQVLDTLDVAVLTCDPGGRVVHSNRAARLQLPGTEKPLTAAAGLRHPDGTLIPDNQQPLVRALAGEDVHGLEVQYTSPGGTHHAVMLHARPLRDTEGHIIGAVHASVDVTTLRQREAELRVFAGVVAHDLRSPLSSIAGYAEVLHNGLTDGAPTDQLHDDLGRIRGAVDRMRRLIEDLLTYATAHDAPLRPEPVNLRTVVADVVTDRTAHMRAPTSGEPVMFPDIHIGSLPMVSADAAMLRQLFDNLIGNALKYTQPGQPARIEISAHHHHTSATPEDDVDGTVWVRVEVADCGIGIPAADQPHIFDTFHRSPAHTGYHGTGLGLAICERIAHRHGGTITVADNPGGGTRFAVTLPLTSPVLPTAPHPEARSLAEPSAACP